MIRSSRFTDIVYEIELSQESRTFRKRSGWNKRLDGLKLTEPFNNKINRRGLDFYRKDTYYVETCRSNRFP